MFQEFEGQKPVVISRNHMDRVRPKSYRWVAPQDWSPAWNMQLSLISGAASGLFYASYYQVHTPLSEIRRFYLFPGTLEQVRIYLREAYKMDSFQKGFGTKLAFYSTLGLTFNASRFYLWKDFAGGFPVDYYTVDVAWYKKLLTSAFVGALTCWIPVPFHNIAVRYHQDKIMPKEHSRGYRGYIHTAYNIALKDGAFPFMRGGLPIMTRFWLETSSTLFWLDFLKDKCLHVQYYGSTNGGFSDTSMRLLYVTFGTSVGITYGYAFETIRNRVEKYPKNSKGERYFESYAEGGLKTLGEYYNVLSTFRGFGRHFLRNAPPLFMSLWFADIIGVFDIYRIESIILPD